MEEKHEIEGKVNWRGEPATKEKHGGMRVALFVLGLFGLENMANLSVAVNGTTYFSSVMHFSIADSANHLTNFLGTGYILCLFMAFLADTYIGRFKTILIAACIELVGLGMMTIQAHYPQLKPPVCNPRDETQHCIQVHGGQAVFLYCSLYLVALGMSGLKAAVPSHGADQFEEDDPKEAKHIPTFFNWILLILCIGGAIGVTVLVWVQDHKGWDKGLALSTFTMFLGVLVFIGGLPKYRIHVAQGSSAISEIIQVYVAAIRNRKLQLPEDSSELYEINMDKEAGKEGNLLPHTDDFRFLDKAAIFDQTYSKEGKDVNPWKLCTVTQVENAKILVRMTPIFCCSIIMTLCLAQLQTFSIQQGITMDTNLTKSFQIPPASLPIIPIVFLIIIIPVYDQIFVPLLRKFTGHPTGITYLQRIGVGLVLSAVSMSTAALMEVKRKKVARTHNMVDAIPVIQPLPISVFWLSIQYFIFGIADMFTYVGLLEFFYSQTPKSLKSISSCFLWISMSFGYFLSTIVVKIVNRATENITRNGGWLTGNNLNRNHVDLFYWLLAILSILNFFVYLLVAKRYKYRAQSTSDIREGNRENMEITA